MQIILLHPRFTQAKSITLGSRHVALAGLTFLTSVLLCAALLSSLGLRLAADGRLPFLRDLVGISVADDGGLKKDKYLKENLAAMAIKLGAMQAQLMRLDALGERVQGLAGVKPEEFNFKESPGQGGAEPTSAAAPAAHVLTISEFQKTLDALAVDVEHRSDYMNVVESTLMSFKVKSKLLPTSQPVNVNYVASSFGLRLDPFTGRSTFHEGLDFPASTGTAIVAAAGGVVIAAEYHPQFGNMIDIDHGNDIMTRYAHASRTLVKVGDIVQRGQHIADVGTTGRSTGPHLHFEVHVKGVPQNPQKFLSAGADQAKIAALAPK